MGTVWAIATRGGNVGPQGDGLGPDVGFLVCTTGTALIQYTELNIDGLREKFCDRLEFIPNLVAIEAQIS